MRKWRPAIRPALWSLRSQGDYRHLFQSGCKKAAGRPVSLPMDQTRVQQLGKFRPRLLSFALRRLRNRAAAEDAVQETLLAALEGIDRFGGASSLGTWLTGILKHKLVDAMRASSNHQPLDYDDDLPHDNDPESELARRRALDAVDTRLKQISSCAARVFVLREVIGMEIAEVCRELAISSSNCSVMHHRAKMYLRGCPTIRNVAADAL